MPAKFATFAFAFVLAAGSLAAQPDPKPKPLDDKKLVTKVYNIKPLLGERGKGAGIADTDAIVKLILENISLGEPKPGADGPQLLELDGGKLEVRATAKTHSEVKDLLDALDRLADVAIDIQAKVIELDTATYEKLVKALPKGKAKLPVLFAAGEESEEVDVAADKAFAEVNKILKAGREVQTSSARFANGSDAVISARRAVAVFKNDPKAINVGQKTDSPLYVKEGFTLTSHSVVSADRRFIRMKLTEQSTSITGIKKRELGEVGGQKIVMQTLETEDLGATGTAVIADGGAGLFKLAYAPKDKVWVVVVKPRLFIQAEEDFLKKEEKK